MAMKKGPQVMKKRKLLGPLNGVGVTIKKQGPVVRVVQVFPPLFVQADESNFCSVVQKLTGKQSAAMAATSQAGSSPPPLSSSSPPPPPPSPSPPPPSPPPPPPSSPSSSSSSSSEDHDQQRVKIQPYIQNNIISASPLPSSVPSDQLSDIRMINDRQHAYHLHSDHFSFSWINDTALSPPAYTSSTGSFYHAESHDSDNAGDDDTPFFDYFDYHHLIDLPALPQVTLDQEDGQWLECSFTYNAC